MTSHVFEDSEIFLFQILNCFWSLGNNYVLHKVVIQMGSWSIEKKLKEQLYQLWFGKYSRTDF